MMHISTLIVETGNNPDRLRPGRTWLQNLYHVHQRLAMGFPSDPRRKLDPPFLQPYAPSDFPPIADGIDVHNPRSDDRGFLFRIDLRPGQSPVILVQSAKKPDWDYAFGNSPLLRYHEVNELPLAYQAQQTLQFRLRANVTRRMAGGPFAGKRIGVGTNRALAMEWLWRKAGDAGFNPLFVAKAPDEWDSRWSLQSGWAFAGRKGDDASMRFQWTQFDGVLEVIEPEKFRDTIIRGIGKAKAFGFGLLSVRPV